MRCMAYWLKQAKEEYGDRTVSNVITQIESRIKHYEDAKSAKINKELSHKLSELGFGKHDVECLASEGIVTLGDLLKQTEESLSKIRGFGKKTVAHFLHYMEWVKKDVLS